MSDDASRSGSETSLRSSLRGWSSLGVTPKSRDEIDVTRTSASSYTSSRALPPAANLSSAGPAAGNPQGVPPPTHPSSSPCLNGPSSGRKLSEGQAPGEGGKPIEQQIKQERIWWSEQTLFEVQKMELALKQELHKTTAGLREQFRRQLEIERNEAQQRSATFDRTLSRLREDVEALRETQDTSSRFRQLSDGFAQSEASMRLELDAMRCTVEDFQRQHSEELSVRLAAFDADRARLQAASTALREDFSSLKDRLAAMEASALTDAQKKASAEEGLVSNQQVELLRMAVRRLEESMEEERTIWAQTTASAAAKSAGDSAVAAEVNARLQDLQKSLESEHGTRASEVSSLRRDMEDVAKEVLKMRDNETMLRENLKAMERRLPDDGGSTLAELTQLLQIECKSRKNDVEELHQQLRLTEAYISERSVPASDTPEVQQTLNDLDMRVGRLVSALETERDHRRSDVDRYSAAVTDVMDALKAERMLRTNELEKLRTALAQLTLNLQSALGSETSESQLKIAAAFASLATALDKDASSGEADKAPDSGASSPQKRAATAELLAEVTTRVEVLSASLRGELTAKAAELRGDMAATRAELLRKIEENLGGGESGSASGGGPLGLQSSAALAGQLNETVRLVQVIAAGTEQLGEKLCDEVTERRQSEVTVSNRISRVEHRLFELGGKDSGVSVPQTSEFFPEDPSPTPGGNPGSPPQASSRGVGPSYGEVLRQQTALSENLKDSLEQLVSRVNRMLKPGQLMQAPEDGRESRRSPSRNRSTAQSREPSAQAGNLAGCPPGRLVSIPDPGQASRPSVGGMSSMGGAKKAAQLQPDLPPGACTGSCAVPCSTPVNRPSGQMLPGSRPPGTTVAAHAAPAQGYSGSFVAPGMRPGGPGHVHGPAGCRAMRPQVSLPLQHQPHGQGPPYSMMGQARPMQARPP